MGNNIGNFCDDTEKMLDFFKLTKEEFLNSYSYLTEDEYLATQKEVERRKQIMARNIRFSNRYMICDEDEGYFDVYVFTTPIEIDELEQFIRKHKDEMQGEVCADWTLESIEKAIREKYPVKDVILFEDGYNKNDIMKI